MMVCTSHFPLPGHWTEIFWYLFLLHAYSLTIEHYNGLDETVDIGAFGGGFLDRTMF